MNKRFNFQRIKRPERVGGIPNRGWLNIGRLRNFEKHEEACLQFLNVFLSLLKKVGAIAPSSAIVSRCLRYKGRSLIMKSVFKSTNRLFYALTGWFIFPNNFDLYF